VPTRHIRTWSKLGIVGATLVFLGTALTGAGVPRGSIKPFLVYHDGSYLVFAPEITGTHRPARLGPWDLGERLRPDEEKPRDKRLNLYVVIPGGQYHSASHPEYDHNLVINKYPSDHKAREWDIFWCLELDPSLPTDLHSEHDLLQAAHQRFQPSASLALREIPASAVMAERLSVNRVEDLKRFRHKDGSLPRMLIVPAHLAVRATAQLESSPNSASSK
jgi:hypothetical protein